MEAITSNGTCFRALAVKVLIKQKHSYRVIFKFFEINTRFLQ